MLQSLPELPLSLCYLEANRCKRLQSLAKLPSFLKQLDAFELESMRDYLEELYIQDEIIWLDVQFLFINCLKLNQNACNNTRAVSQQRILHMATIALLYAAETPGYYPDINICLPGNEVPEWFSYRSFGSSLTIQLPQHWFNSNFMGFALCVVIAFEKLHSDDTYRHVDVSCKICFENVDRVYSQCILKIPYDDDVHKSIDSDHICFAYHPCLYAKSLEVEGDYKASFEFCPIEAGRNHGVKVKCCGVSPLYAQPNSISIEEFGATDQDSEETMVEEYEDETNTSGRSDEDEVEPHSENDPVSFADYMFFGI